MNRVCYTCILNDYDWLKEPKVTEGWTYICFTNRSPASKHWNIVQVDARTIKDQRRIKILADYLWKGYHASLWVDGSIEVRCDLNEFVDRYAHKDFALMKHPGWSSLTSEAGAIISARKDEPEVVNEQLKAYMDAGYDDSLPMVATGVMYRKHTRANRIFCERWYKEVERYSHRDQMSFNYCAWRDKLTYNTFSWDVLSDKEFRIYGHNKRRAR